MCLEISRALPAYKPTEVAQLPLHVFQALHKYYLILNPPPEKEDWEEEADQPGWNAEVIKGEAV